MTVNLGGLHQKVFLGLNMNESTVNKMRNMTFNLNVKPAIQLKDGKILLSSALTNTNDLDTLTPILDFSNCISNEKEGDQICLYIETPLEDILKEEINDLIIEGKCDFYYKPHFDSVKEELTKLINKIDEIVYSDEFLKDPVNTQIDMLRKEVTLSIIELLKTPGICGISYLFNKVNSQLTYAKNVYNEFDYLINQLKNDKIIQENEVGVITLICAEKNKNELGTLERISSCILYLLKKSNNEIVHSSKLINLVRKLVPETMYMQGDIIYVINSLITNNKIKMSNDGDITMIDAKMNADLKFDIDKLHKNICNCIISLLKKSNRGYLYPDLIQCVNRDVTDTKFYPGEIVRAVDYLQSTNKITVFKNTGFIMLANDEPNNFMQGTEMESVENMRTYYQSHGQVSHHQTNEHVILTLKNKFKLQFGFEPTTEQIIQHALNRMMNDEPTTRYNPEENRSPFVPPQKFNSMPTNYPASPPPFVGNMNPPGYIHSLPPYMNTYRPFNPGLYKPFNPSFEQDKFGAQQQQSSPFNTQHPRTWTDFNNFVEPPPPLKKSTVNKASDFLIASLNKKERLLPELIIEAKAFGISEAALIRAKKLLNVSHKKQQGAGQSSPFVWYFESNDSADKPKEQ